MTNSHKVIYVAANPQQAHIAGKRRWCDQGIYAYVTNEALQVAAGDLPLGTPTAPRVVVHEEDADEARRSPWIRRDRRTVGRCDPANRDAASYDLADLFRRSRLIWGRGARYGDEACDHARRRSSLWPIE